MFKKESLLKDAFVKIPLSEIPKMFEIALTVMFISYTLGKTKQ